MAKDYSTPLSRVRRHGAAHEGVAHFIGQRGSAVAQSVLVPAMVISVLVSALTEGGVLGLLSSFWGAMLAILFFTSCFYHMRIGLQVVIEDYIHKTPSRVTLLLLNSFFAFAIWAAVTVSILKLALGG